VLESKFNPGKAQRTLHPLNWSASPTLSDGIYFIHILDEKGNKQQIIKAIKQH
jgi:hypothetical protein